jgi:hypothetical protein
VPLGRLGDGVTLESVRRELWDAGRPTKLAELGRGRATLFDDRVEIGRTTIELVPELKVDVTVSVGGGYLTVLAPDTSKTIKLRTAEEAAARTFAAAVRAAADRVDEVHTERSRRVQELEARLARLVGPLAEAERPVEAPDGSGGSGHGPGGVAEGVVLPPEPRAPADPPGPVPSAAGAAAPIVPSSPVAATPGRTASRRKGRSRRRRGAGAAATAGPAGAAGAAGADRAPGRPRGSGRLARRDRPRRRGRPARQARTRRRSGLRALRLPRLGRLGRLGGPGRPRTAVALLALVAVAAGAGTLTWYLAAHRSSVPEISGSSDPGSPDPPGSSGGASQTATQATPPGGRPGAGDGGARVGPEADRSRVQRLQRGLRGRFDVVSTTWENDVLVARLRSGDVGAFFEMVHASGLDPDQTVLEQYATVDGSGEVVAVYSLSRAQAEALNWREANKIRWNDFLTYRRR